MKLKKGDTVKVMTGKDKGKTGTIETAFPSTGKVLIEGVNVVKRHIKKSGRQSGRIVEAPRPIDASNVMLIDPKDKKPTRVGRKVEDGKIVRFAKKSGTTLK